MKYFKFNFFSALLVTLFFSSCSYNTMVEKEESVTAQWSQVENAYQRRADLIPNLVNTVKGYMSHENKTLTDVIEARAKATSVSIDANNLSEENLKKFQEAQGALGTALNKLMMVQEQYPDLKANTMFISLQDEITGSENRIATERNKFNERVKDHNQYIRSFPQVIWAGWFGFKEKGYFKAEDSAQKVPEVGF